MNQLRTLALVLLCTYQAFSQITYQVSGTGPTTLAFTQANLTSIGSTTKTTFYINADVSLSTNVTVTPNITLKFLHGSVIRLNTYDLKINGPIEAGAYPLFYCNSSGKTIGYPIVDHVYPQWWKSSDDGLYWTKAIQRAVDFYPRVIFPSLPPSGYYYINGTVTLDMNKITGPVGFHLSGVGRESLLETGLAPYNGYIFQCINVPNAGFRDGLIIENLTMFCKNGIEIMGGDSGNAAFTTENKSINQIKIKDCRFHQNTGSNPTGSHAIFMRKVYDSDFTNNFILDFEYGIHMEGCDLNTIMDNRIMNFYKYAIFDRGYTTTTGSFGSQNLIIHNDLLGYKGLADNNAFIKTNSNHIIIRDNYLENTTNNSKIFAYIDCSLKDLPVTEYGTTLHDSYHIDITGNRCDSNKNVTSYIYYITENFRSLILREIPNWPEWGTDIYSSFTKTSVSGTTYTHTPVNNIPIKVSNLQLEKSINMENCDSFKNWENFSTTKIFEHSSNGDFVVDSRNISAVSDHSGYVAPVFNPRSFRLAADGAAEGCDPCPALGIKINQQLIAGELGDEFKNMAIKFKVRNLNSAGAGTDSTDDLYMRIDQNGSTYLTNNSIDVKNGNNYQVIKFTLPVAKTFDPLQEYIMYISSKTAFVKEFKEIIFESADVQATDSDTYRMAAEATDEKDKTPEETTQTLYVKVDNKVDMAPNPATSDLKINIKPGNEIKSVKVYTENGTFIGDYTNRIENNSIDISNLPNAVYLVKVVSVDETTGIIIKE